MLHAFHWLSRQFQSRLAVCGADSTTTQRHPSGARPSAMVLAPDWQVPAYLRRRVSGDGLACPWPPRQ